MEAHEGADGALAESVGADHRGAQENGHQPRVVDRPGHVVRAARPQEDVGDDAARNQTALPQEEQERVRLAEGDGKGHAGNQGAGGAAQDRPQNRHLRVCCLNLHYAGIGIL